jgi:cytochrome c oxidase subunit II
MRLWNQFGGVATSVAGLMAGSAAVAQGLEIVGVPVDGGTGFQPAATELARDLQGLDWMMLIIITFITIFVTGLLVWVIMRYNERRNPKPATFTHNSPLEVAWTVVPILILVFIGAFSLPVLFKQQEIPVGDITIKVTGYQWYWGYEYVDDGITPANEEGATPVAFDSYMIGAPATGGDNRLSPEVSAQLQAAGYTDKEFLLATDTAVVVPVGKTIVMQVTGGDVIHSWTIPAFGVKQDAVPGRLAQLWFTAEREGVYFGQCSELCGIAHAYMPITVKVVSEQVYAQWLEAAKAGDVVLSAADIEAYSAVKLAANN